MSITPNERAEQESWMEELETRIGPAVSPWRTCRGKSSSGEANINVQAYLPHSPDVTFGLQLQNGLLATRPKRTLKVFCQPHPYLVRPSVEQREEIERMLERFRRMRTPKVDPTTEAKDFEAIHGRYHRAILSNGPPIY